MTLDQIIEGFVIGMKGLEKPSKIALFPDSLYYMGASSSPEAIIVLKVDDNSVIYADTWDLKERRMERWVAEDLINRGVNTWLKSKYTKFHPELVKSLKANLDGKKGSENGKEQLSDYERFDVEVLSTSKEPITSRANDPWYELEQYGGVGGLGDNKYVVHLNAKALKDLKKDKSFEITKITKRSYK